MDTDQKMQMISVVIGQTDHNQRRKVKINAIIEMLGMWAMIMLQLCNITSESFTGIS